MNEQEILEVIENAKASKANSLYLSDLQITTVPQEINKLTDLEKDRQR